MTKANSFHSLLIVLKLLSKLKNSMTTHVLSVRSNKNSIYSFLQLFSVSIFVNFLGNERCATTMPIFTIYTQILQLIWSNLNSVISFKCPKVCSKMDS